MSNSEPRLLHRTIPLTHLMVLGIWIQVQHQVWQSFSVKLHRHQRLVHVDYYSFETSASQWCHHLTDAASDNWMTADKFSLTGSNQFLLGVVLCKKLELFVHLLHIMCGENLLTNPDLNSSIDSISSSGKGNQESNIDLYFWVSWWNRWTRNFDSKFFELCKYDKNRFRWWDFRR